jgi:hypothetical protein
VNQLQSQQIQEAVFVFLHGPAAYPNGGWEPILLDVLHEVGFTKAAEVQFHPRLSLTRYSGGEEGVVGGVQEYNELIPFSVMVLEPSRLSTICNQNATRWLNEIALRMEMLREKYLGLKKKIKEATLADFRRMAESWRTRETLDELSEERKLIANDPKTTSEYEAMH